MLNNPRMIALSIALILVAGLVAIQQLPRQEDPHFGNRYGFVQLRFDGASAERVESLAVEPVESALRVLPEVKHVIAKARAGIAVIAVQLEDEVLPEETDRVWAEVRDKLEEAGKTLPPGVAPPLLDKDRSYAYTWIGALVWKGEGEPDVLRLGRYAKELKTQLQSLPDTELVRLYGEPAEEVQVRVDTVKAAAIGLDVPRIAELLALSDAKTSAGQLVDGQYRQSLELVGGYDQLERVRRTPVRSLQDGGALQLQDIAHIDVGEPDSPASFTIIDQRRGIGIAARMDTEARGDIWTATLQERIAEFSANLPQEIAIEELFVQQRYTSQRLQELIGNILLGFVFIFTILLFTLGWRSAVIVALSLPLTMLFALAMMFFTGLPIHQMSVTGLIVALGIMVDNAIVTTDQVNRYRRRGLSGFDAANRAFRHLWVPLLGSTLTTMLTFLPIALMPGPQGEFVGAISLTVIFSLLGSWLISLFIIAPIAGHWLRGRGDRAFSLPRLTTAYRTGLATVLKHPRRSLLLSLLLPFSGVLLALTLPDQFFPPSDRDMISLDVYLPASSSIHNSREAALKVGEHIRRHPEVKSLHWFIGQSAPLFYYNLKAGEDGAANYAQAMLTMHSVKQANRMVAVLQSEMNAAFPEYQVVVRRLEQGPPNDAPVELRVSGHNIGKLKELGDQLRAVAWQTEGVAQVRDSLGEVVPKIWLDVDESEAQRAGAGLRDLSRVLSASIDGVVTSSMLDGTEQLPVRVSGWQIRESSVDRIMSMPLALPAGPRPLSAVADVRLSPAQAMITRRDSRRVNNIYVFVEDGQLPLQVLERIMQGLDKTGFSVPAGYELEIGGDSEARDEAVGKLLGSVGIIAVLLLVTVVMAFNSFRLSALVFAVAILSLGMGMLSLWMSRYPFGFTSIIALMGLMGLAVNAAIVILTELKSSPQAMAGNIAEIVETVVECTRHISSTTITTVAGLIPLIVAGGDFWPPFAIILAGGTVLTSLLSLIFVPAGFLVLRRLRVDGGLPSATHRGAAQSPAAEGGISA